MQSARASRVHAHHPLGDAHHAAHLSEELTPGQNKTFSLLKSNFLHIELVQLGQSKMLRSIESKCILISLLIDSNYELVFNPRYQAIQSRILIYLAHT